jgi:calcineurin-like phosphoesterase family protein
LNYGSWLPVDSRRSASSGPPCDERVSAARRTHSRRWFATLLAFGLSGCAAHFVSPSDVPRPAPADLAATVLLIGDAGNPKASGEPVLAAARRVLGLRSDTAAILFLGDNIYPRGMPDSTDGEFPEAARRIRAQLALDSIVPTYFVPGNHDWDRSGREGLARIRRQGSFIAREGEGRARLLPSGGCPGPDTVAVGRILLVLLDTEWWLFPHEKSDAHSHCAATSGAEVVAALERILAASAGRQVIVAGHHPILTGGPHGGRFSAADALFPLRAVNSALWIPLPIIGLAYPAIRGMGISPEDVSNAAYRRLRASLDSAFACHPPAIYAAGHEHTLQVLDRQRAPLLLVSGTGIYGHTSYVERLPESRLALATGGFMRADLLRDGRLRIGVVTASPNGEPTEVYAQLLPPADTTGGSCRSAGATQGAGRPQRAAR